MCVEEQAYVGCTLERKYLTHDTQPTKCMCGKCDRTFTGIGILNAKGDASAWKLCGEEG
jgi:hypothetical protein